MNQPKSTVAPIKSSTQSFLEIDDIKDSIVILRDGSCVIILSTTAINFGLLSEKEQDAAIYAYGALLNSLTFPVQILICSKRKDISSYLRLLEEREKKTAKRVLKDQIRKYREFVESTIQINNVLEKKFYLVIPMSFLELGIGKTVGSKLKKTGDLPFPKEYILEKAKTNLYPKRDHLFRLLNRLGLRSRQLNTHEIARLFFEIYNPDTQGQVVTNAEDYQTPLVKPAASFLEVTPPPTETEEEILSEPAPEKQKTEELIEEEKETLPQTQIDNLVKTGGQKLNQKMT